MMTAAAPDACGNYRRFPFITTLGFVVIARVASVQRDAPPRIAELITSDKKNQTKIACIGDSITRGACNSGTNEYAYPSILQDLLGEGFDVANYGLDGRGVLEESFHPIWSEDSLPVLETAKSTRPDIVVMMFGTNDAKKTPFPEDSFKADYKRLIDKFARSGTQLYIAIPPPVYKASDENHAGIAPTLNRVIPRLVTQIARENGIELIDIHASFIKACPDTDKRCPEFIAQKFPPGEKRDTCDNDYVHPNDKGYKMIAKKVHGNIKEAMRQRH